ncbi:MAG: hypothetical protein E4G94_00750 [ANME-2 cluster archaeon]|nr:MAG: hypothetical protein E4G94_00750 [ANME-2 cluster archaeon]
MTENLLNVSNISLHADHIEDFENISIFTNQLTNFNLSDNHYSGLHEDSGNHSAVLNYTNLVGYLGNSLNITNGSKYKGISVFVNATSNTNTTLILGVYTDAWYNYTRVIDWTGWKEINIIYHNDTVNETRSFNATGDPTKISFGVNGTNSNGSIYFDDLRQAVSDDYHQYVSWKCTDCHTQTKNLPGITDITSPITDCSLCHNQNEPHFKQFTLICMDCHFESGHGDVDPTFTDYEKASTCLKCHTQIHDFNQTHLESYPCSNCHDLRVHGQNAQLVTYNESIHLTCERCHGKATAKKPLPLTLGNPGSIFLRLSYTYNNETQCNFCHQNRSNAYILHTNLTVNESNIDSINNDTICTSCHDPIPSATNILDRDELTADDTQREPHAPQILGHGNVSCYKCHGHQPETLTLTIGQDCVGCHQDPTELVELTPGKINKSPLSNVTNPGALQLIVISPQTTGHGNTSCAECHGHKNSDLTSVGSDAESCINCHENASSNVSLIEYREPNSIRSTKLAYDEDAHQWYVNPPRVVGHGNTSCKECHDHTPSSFKGTSLVGGTDCSLCHQNISTNVTLINNTVPASANTGVIDNSTSVWIVHAPQVSGHGQADCSICHSHNVENLVYNGGTDNDCITCHYNESAGTYLLQNGSYVVPPQVVPHNDLNCSECHGHTPNSMTHGNGVDCRVCHQNTTKAQSLSDTYGIGLNLTSPAGNISAVQIPALNHSTGVKWNKTSAYWTNDSEACQYCHKISVNYSNHNPLGRISVIAGNNTKNSSLVDSYWCAACHYENYSSGSVTFDDSVELFLEAGLPVPPEIAANLSYGNYTYANDGLTKYYDHSLSDYSDEKCAGCHGESDNTKEFVHHVVGGFASCIGCHDYGDTNSDYRMNNTDMKLSVHANLNSNASNSTGVHADNKKCWGCHTSDGQEPVIDMGDKYTNPYTCMECHNTTSKAYYNVSNAPAVYNHFGSGEQTLKQKGNDILSCMACHNKDEMKVNFSEDDSFRSNRSVVSHYAMNFTPLSSLRNYTNSTQYCIFCHDNDTSIFNIFVTEKTNHGLNCSVCHGAGRIHDELSDGYTPSLPSTPGGNVSGCLGCHADANSTISKIYLLNMTMFNDSVHYLRDGFNCLNCHISDDDQHPINEYKWKWCECWHYSKI